MSLRTPVSKEDHMQGNPDAPIELLEYGDYQCPYCGRAYPIIKKLQIELGSKLKFVFRNFPLTTAHPQAMMAAMAGEAAALQGKFWPMHDLLFENQQQLDPKYLSLYAERIGLDVEQFETDFQKDAVSAKIDADFNSGNDSGVNGTPTFYVNGKKYTGDWGQDEFTAYLKHQLNSR